MPVNGQLQPVKRNVTGTGFIVYTNPGQAGTLIGTEFWGLNDLLDSAIGALKDPKAVKIS